MLPDLISFQRQFVGAIDNPATGALSVYRNTVIHGAVEALRSNFPVVEQIVGEEMFEGIAVEFSQAKPPQTPVLALYGADFAQWLGQQPWIGDLPYLPDVARVERLHVECLMAADAEALTELGGDTGALRVKLHPAVRFRWLQTPAMSIWLAHQRPVPPVIEPDWKPEGALFARPSAFLMHTPRIGASAHRILSGIRLGESVAESLAASTRLHPGESAEAVFASLLNLGAFAAPSERT
ncbi:putative DNA-binding domain-containing protein [Sphingomonas daechungensis]|uniref:HvfC/BufC family peptide modification chaperone n=1 Tax=Sphingomonas daechungensis TaxID=1176646 RepID=UPI003783BE3C